MGNLVCSGAADKWTWAAKTFLSLSNPVPHIPYEQYIKTVLTFKCTCLGYLKKESKTKEKKSKAKHVMQQQEQETWPHGISQRWLSGELQLSLQALGL